MKRVLLGAAVLGLSACSRWTQQPPANEIFVSGRVEGDEVDLAFKTPGRIVEILVREGDAVKAGQVLARLSADQERTRLKEAEARLAGARARVAQARTQAATFEQRVATTRLQQDQAQADAPPRVEQARASLAALRADLARVEADAAQNEADAKRYEDLAARGAAPRQMAEQHATRLRASRAAIDAIQKQIHAAESAVTVSEAGLRTAGIRDAEARTYERQIDEARAAAKLAEAEAAAAAAAVEMAGTQLNELELKSPIDGTVITRAAEPGRVIAAGAAVLTIVDLGSLYLRAFVPEGDIARVKLGQKAEVFLDSAPGKALEAEVSRVDPRAMFTPENTYFRDERVKQVVGVKLRLTHAGGAAKPGMTAEGRILD